MSVMYVCVYELYYTIQPVFFRPHVPVLSVFCNYVIRYANLVHHARRPQQYKLQRLHKTVLKLSDREHPNSSLCGSSEMTPSTLVTGRSKFSSLLFVRLSLFLGVCWRFPVGVCWCAYASLALVLSHCVSIVIAADDNVASPFRSACGCRITRKFAVLVATNPDQGKDIITSSSRWYVTFFHMARPRNPSYAGLVAHHGGR